MFNPTDLRPADNERVSPKAPDTRRAALSPSSSVQQVGRGGIEHVPPFLDCQFVQVVVGAGRRSVFRFAFFPPRENPRYVLKSPPPAAEDTRRHLNEVYRSFRRSVSLIFPPFDSGTVPVQYFRILSTTHSSTDDPTARGL
ncbi:hypothetical protein GWI33_014597 [Rhynchophorus ferrugineus]|uniref:Uncharacterized protein n=1 Tax=Rhynchophorus ferrugineus TaxID=354439 RepID=A0A834I491_RHYFE|nr:hypothetical protein GWI33_014597 [Rhynchophorus ferrugineus]